MVNYKNSKIYKIICNITQNEYYGSTTKQYLSSRLQQHKTQYHRWLNDNKKKYYSSFEIIKNGDYKIILVEKLECNDKDELRQKEQFFIDNNICVNKNRAFNTKEDTKKYEKKYRAINKDKIDERHKKYIEINKDKIKAQYKEYYENNKEKQKEYYENNKEILNEQRRKMKKDKRAFLNSWGYEKIIFSCNLLNIDLSIFD